MDTSVIYLMGIIMIGVGGGFLYMQTKGRKDDRPRDGMEWAGLVLSAALVVSAVALMVMAGGSSGATPVVRAQQTADTALEDIIMEEPAGNFSFTGVHDDIVRNLADYKGKVVIINYWATWCAPCRAEIPDLNRLQAKYADDGLVILSISDEPRDLLIAFEEQLPMETYRMRVPEYIELPMPFTGALIIRPATYILDREGTVRRYLLGSRSFDFFERSIQDYL